MSDLKAGFGYLILKRENYIFKGMFRGDKQQGDGEMLPIEDYGRVSVIDVSKIEKKASRLKDIEMSITKNDQRFQNLKI